jgi:hypothetical protein
METCRIPAKAVLLASSLILLFHAGEVVAQERQGIRPNVRPPEGCYLTEPAEPDSLYSLTKVQIQALWLARTGEQADFDLLTARGDLPMNQMAKMITGLREERVQYICAAFVLSAYTQSSNENAAKVAKFLVFSYQELENMTGDMLQILLQGTSRSNRTSTQVRYSQWMNKRQKTLGDMVQALEFSLSLLVDEGRKDPEGNPDHLILTGAQRDTLLNYLSSKFPALEDERKVKHSGDFLEQVILIHSFLTGKYKPADYQ